MSKQKKILLRIIITALLFTAGMITVAFVEMPWWAQLCIFVGVYGVIAYDIFIKAFKGMLHGQFLDENLLMIIATIGAFVVREYPEAVLVMWLYQIGELFQSYALGKSRKSIGKLMDIRPDSARVKRGGEEIVVSPEEVEIGETVIVRPGEKIPLDGKILSGESALNMAALTGESVPQRIGKGDTVLSGSINLSTQIEMECEKEFYDSTASKILDLVENASARKAKAENFITKFARWYTPIVVLAALLLAVIPSVVSIFVPTLSGWQTWVYRAMSFLVASCPCALVISIPLGFFGGIGGVGRAGVLVKGGNYLELLAKTDVIVMDKTGTVTKGVFEVQRVMPETKREEILRLAAVAESGSTHPIALSIMRAAGTADADGFAIEEVAGKGIRAVRDSEVILAGNAKLMISENIDFVQESDAGTIVYIAHNGEFIGSILLGDEIKESSKDAIAELKKDGCRTCMLTGDGDKVAREVAEYVGIDEVHSKLLPKDKVDRLERIISEKDKGSVVAFVGDGINDAPVLMRADVGIAMGALGSDSAIEAADVVLMHDDLKSISVAKKLAKRTVNICRQNIVFVLLVKAVVLVLSALGITNMWLAIFADVGVMILAVLNAMRTMFVKKKKVVEKKTLPVSE